MDDYSIRITRHSEPTQQDDAPFKSECVVRSGELFDVYVQMSKSATPNWIFLGKFPFDSINAEIEKFLLAAT
jgi:hypothetical protein